MRISRKKRPQKSLLPRYNINNFIKSPEVRVIDIEGKNLGVFSVQEANKLAEEQELDLVEINPKANPPVAQLINYGNFKYQKEKELRKQKINAHVSEVKGIRLSIRISEHDLEVRQMQAERFLDRGDKVKAEIILKGRELSKIGLAFETVNKFTSAINEKMPIRFDQEATRQGNKVTAIVAKK